MARRPALKKQPKDVFRQERSDTKGSWERGGRRTAVLEFGHLFSAPETAPEPERSEDCLICNKPLLVMPDFMSLITQGQ